MIGPIILWAHQETDEEPEQYLEALEQTGATREELEIAAVFLDRNPLYEVRFEFYLNASDATEWTCTKVDLGDGQPFTRPHPGAQLTLFDQEHR